MNEVVSLHDPLESCIITICQHNKYGHPVNFSLMNLIITVSMLKLADSKACVIERPFPFIF